MHLSAIFVVAHCAMREHARRHLLHVVILLSLLAIGFAVGMSLLGGDAHTKILKDLAVASLLLFGGALAVVLSVVSIGPEVESRMILPVLARPIPRAQYVLGRYLGTLGTAYVGLVMMAFAFAAALLVLDRQIAPGFWLVLAFVAVQVAVMAAVGTAVGVFCAPPLAAVLTLFLFFAGSVKIGYGARLLERVGDGTARSILTLLTRPLPNLEAFDFRDALVHGLPVPGMYMTQVALYAALYTAAALALACWRFEGREL